jgi:hypothetical protein
LSFDNRRHRKMIHVITRDWMCHDGYEGLLCSDCFKRASGTPIRLFITSQGTLNYSKQICPPKRRNAPKPQLPPAEDTIEECSALHG